MEGKTKLDKIVEGAGVGLASKSTRRGFLGRVAGVAGATLFGGAVILGEQSEGRADASPAGCFGTTDGVVCWRAWKVQNNWPGFNGVPMFKGPSSSSPYVYNNGIVTAPIWRWVCRQSNRTTAANGCGDPGSRATVNGFMYVYGYDNHKQGWVPYYVNGVYYLTQDTANQTCCGPMDVDYDCGKAKSYCPGYNGCTGQAAGSVTTSGAYWSIRDAGSDEANSDQQFYIRYARNGTSHGWCIPGDKIKRLAYTSTGWSCIYAYCNAWLPYGCRGWMDSSALGTSGTYSSCTGNGNCPSGSYYP